MGDELTRIGKLTDRNNVYSTPIQNLPIYFSTAFASSVSVTPSMVDENLTYIHALVGAVSPYGNVNLCASPNGATGVTLYAYDPAAPSTKVGTTITARMFVVGY